MKKITSIRKLNPATDYEEFYLSLKEARGQHHYGLFVALEDKEVYQDMILFMIGDREAGVAVHNGNIVAVHKNPQRTQQKDLMKSLATTAIENGGEKLDCYGEHLVKEYMKYGLLPVGRMKFDINVLDEENRKEWLKRGLGEPDVVALLLPPQGKAKPIDLSYSDIKEFLPYFDDYDKMLEFRDALLADAKANGKAYDEILEYLQQINSNKRS